MMNRYALIYLLTLLTFSAHTSEVNRYEQPVPYVNYITNIEPVLQKAVQYYNWQLKTDEQGHFLAELLYKDNRINIAFIDENNSIAIKLLSTKKENCKKKKRCKVDEDDLQKWLVNLRRAVGVEVTIAIKKQAMKAYLATE
ncbi:hypothetical protein [Litorilituus lipolyticus]|uniref:Uncharacterized protein n=1 Tax=Litorilituus lipolyticus TaxID=2491017 RepID=A0A502KV96_9GAMM|nr:hypothetical protein [Litorilituus lipolyticus]TPH15578.1 hypothetical protein EPA86_08330 [Litorilituus lipolyticus]